MEEFDLKRLIASVRDLDDAGNYADAAKLVNQAHAVPAPEVYGALLRNIKVCGDVCTKIRFLRTSQKISMSLSLMHLHPERFDNSSIATELRNIVDTIMLEASEYNFVRINPAKAEYFNQPALFGDAVKAAFPRAALDILASGDCLALEQETACIFHLMRVAEHGIRMLAKKLRVKLTHKGLSHPIEYADWEKVINGAKNKIAKARDLPHGPKRQKQLEIYSDAADHCVFMKDIWRNNISHTRKPYINAEAVGVLERVRDFMRFIATNLV
jgi:hypothetical protein